AAERGFLWVYNRPCTALNFLEWQLSHTGVVHGAQLTRAVPYPPLWTRYSPDFTARQIDRFLRHLSVAYWQDYAPGLTARLVMEVEGAGGGLWHLVAAPDGGLAGPGALPEADFHLRFANPAVLFGVFTMELPLLVAWQAGSCAWKAMAVQRSAGCGCSAPRRRDPEGGGVGARGLLEIWTTCVNCSRLSACCDLH
ncbi:MAG: hypothetical protein HC915_09960, partial [Anaerolineae bacterium]|nr:hypothetical protein [Anaerolineae bacterium]